VHPERGDVVRSVDPFKAGESRERPWLIVSNDSHPYGDEQFIAVALTTSSHLPAHPLRDEYWEVGGAPEESFVLPWAVHSPRRETIEAWQGRLTPSFVNRVVDEVVAYLR
jgi:mRNA-degrading endonuclease toxin of MazEF toxin-antitoxin module